MGHGLSEGERMYITDFNNYCKDVVQHVIAVKNKHHNVPFFIIGYSMVSTQQTLSRGFQSVGWYWAVGFPKSVSLGQIGLILITLPVPSTYTQNFIGFFDFPQPGCTRGVQVKLSDPLRTRAIPEHLRCVITTRRYTNPCLFLCWQPSYWEWHFCPTQWACQLTSQWVTTCWCQTYTEPVNSRFYSAMKQYSTNLTKRQIFAV